MTPDDTRLKDVDVAAAILLARSLPQCAAISKQQLRDKLVRHIESAIRSYRDGPGAETSWAPERQHTPETRT